MKKLYSIAALIILITSVIYFKGAAGSNHELIMKELVPQAIGFEQISGTLYRAVGIQDEAKEEVLGYIKSDQAYGYSGPIDVVVFIDKDGVVKNLSVLNNTETPSFFSRVMAADYLEYFKGKEANSCFAIGQDIDGISGATFTAKGIAEAVKKSAYTVASGQLSMPLPDQPKMDIPIASWYVLGLMLIVFVFYKLKLTRFRSLTLLAGLIIIGFWQKSPVSLGNIAALLAGNAPSLDGIPIWFLLIIGSLVMILLSGKNLYCYWICPMGAIAEFSGKLGAAGKITYRPCAKRAKRFRGLRLFFAWGALVMSFFLVNPSAASYEIFAPLFAHVGNSAQWVLLPFMLFIGVVLNRFWCSYFCPVGAIWDFLARLRRDCKKWIEMQMGKNITKTTSSIR